MSKARWAGSVVVNGDRSFRKFVCRACSVGPCNKERDLSGDSPVNCMNVEKRKQCEKEVEELEVERLVSKDYIVLCSKSTKESIEYY